MALSILSTGVYLLLRRIVCVMLLANFDQSVKVAEEVGHDGGERCVVTGGAHASFAMGAGGDSDGYVFG